VREDRELASVPAQWFLGRAHGAAIVFFTYIGFDSVSTAAEECRRPQRDLPIGIIGTLIVCAILYISVALVLTGIANYKTLTMPPRWPMRSKSLDFRHPAMGERRGDRGHALVAAGISVRAGAGVVCDVPRRAAAAGILQGSRALQDAAYQHLVAVWR